MEILLTSLLSGFLLVWSYGVHDFAAGAIDKRERIVGYLLSFLLAFMAMLFLLVLGV